MPTIVERKRKDGSIAYLAQIIIKRKGKTAFQESRTFDRRTAANTWAKMRTKEVAATGDQIAKLKNRAKTLSDATEKYTRESQKNIHLQDLAEYLDERRTAAQREYRQMYG